MDNSALIQRTYALGFKIGDIVRIAPSDRSRRIFTDEEIDDTLIILEFGLTALRCQFIDIGIESYVNPDWLMKYQY